MKTMEQSMGVKSGGLISLSGQIRKYARFLMGLAGMDRAPGAEKGLLIQDADGSAHLSDLKINKYHLVSHLTNI